MSHLAEELLRRSVDEPGALLSYEKEHLLQCVRCRTQRERLREHAAFAAHMLAPDETVDLDAAHRSILARARIDVQEMQRADGTRAFPVRLVQWSAALAAAILLVALIGYTPLRGYAQNFLAIFEPHQFVPVGVTTRDLSQMHALPDLSNFGTMDHQAMPTHATYSNAAQAGRAAHEAILWPRFLPAGMTSRALYHVVDRHSVTFTFSAAKTQAFARRASATVPALPPNLDGARITASLGPIVAGVYGDTSMFESHAREINARHGEHVPHMKRGEFPRDAVVIVQAPAPRVYSSGATLVQIEAYLLGVPGIPPNLAAQIRAIGDPSTTVPVPIQVDKQNAQNVNVNGTPGLLIGDNTGIASAIIWQKNGMVYGVAGPFAASQMLQVANSLAP